MAINISRPLMARKTLVRYFVQRNNYPASIEEIHEQTGLSSSTISQHCSDYGESRFGKYLVRNSRGICLVGVVFGIAGELMDAELEDSACERAGLGY
jgi:hypothetical protein